MKRLWRNFLSFVAFCMIPILVFMFKISKLPNNSFKEVYVDWKEWHLSGKAWGSFDSDLT